MANLLLGRSPRASYSAYHALALRPCMSIKYPTTYLSRREHQRHNHTAPYAVPDVLQREGIDNRTGEHTRLVCSEYNISLPTALRPPKGLKFKPNPCKLSISVSEQHCIRKYSMKYLDKFEHPFAKSILGFYASQKQIPLWYDYVSHSADPFPTAVAKKRIGHAFRDALAAYGYDRNGRRIATEDGSSVIADLCGTVQLTCGDPKAACNIKFAELLEQTKMIVSRLELLLARDKNGKRIGSGVPNKKSPKSFTRQGSSPPRKQFNVKSGP